MSTIKKDKIADRVGCIIIYRPSGKKRVSRRSKLIETVTNTKFDQNRPDVKIYLLILSKKSSKRYKKNMA